MTELEEKVKKLIATEGNNSFAKRREFMEAIKIPEKIYALRLKKVELEIKEAGIKLAVAEIEAQVASVVLSAINEKEKPLFSNDAARRAEITRRLNENNKYKGFISIELPDINKLIKLNDAALEYEYNMLKIHLAKNCPFTH